MTEVQRLQFIASDCQAAQITFEQRLTILTRRAMAPAHGGHVCWGAVNLTP